MVYVEIEAIISVGGKIPKSTFLVCVIHVIAADCSYGIATRNIIEITANYYIIQGVFV